ncbi:damage-control phosphatase ARMT1 family protein [Virgisporangium aurantiacum]
MEPILSNVPGSLAWHVWHERHPVLFARIKEAHPFPPEIHTALDGLLAETLTPPWLDAPFLSAESTFYRRLLDAIGYFSPGPWAGFDLFAFLKDADLASAPLHDLPELTPAEHLIASLWGNQADLGFQLGIAVGPAAHLVADDTDDALSVLTGAARVGLVADNAGKELLADLGLIDFLLGPGGVGAVTLYLKPHPYYASAATTTDLVKCLRALAGAGGRAAGTADRLHAAAAAGRLLIDTDPFFCAPLPFHEAPPDLFGRADVLIFKGDLNYRRLVGDNHWPTSTPFASTLPAFDGTAVVALRTLKSDVLVGVDDAVVAALADQGDWRTNGRYGSVQVFIP